MKRRMRLIGETLLISGLGRAFRAAAAAPNHQWWHAKFKLSWNIPSTVHTLCSCFFLTGLAPILYAQSALINKNFCHRSSGLLRVRCWLGSSNSSSSSSSAVHQRLLEEDPTTLETAPRSFLPQEEVDAFQEYYTYYYVFSPFSA